MPSSSGKVASATCVGQFTTIEVDSIAFRCWRFQREEADPYQLLDGACNRKKSWACQHCANWLKLKNFDTCLSCYWANPDSYTHVAMQPERRVDIVWKGGEVKTFERLQRIAVGNKRSVADEIKAIVAS